MIVQPRGVPQSCLTLKWQILHVFCTLGSLWGSQRRAPDNGIVSLLCVIPEIYGSTRNFEFTRNIRYYPMFRLTCYLTISKTELGRVGYRKKYRVAGRLRLPAGHWLFGNWLMLRLLKSSGRSGGGREIKQRKSSRAS